MGKNNTNNCEAFEKVIYVDRLARAYVPNQKYCTLFNLQESLVNGTIFPELYQPYINKNI